MSHKQAKKLRRSVPDYAQARKTARLKELERFNKEKEEIELSEVSEKESVVRDVSKPKPDVIRV